MPKSTEGTKKNRSVQNIIGILQTIGTLGAQISRAYPKNQKKNQIHGVQNKTKMVQGIK